MRFPGFRVSTDKVKFKLESNHLKSKGEILDCGYFNIETFNRAGEVCAIVTGVSNHNEMLKAKVMLVSDAALKIGIVIGETGAEAINKMKTKSVI